MTPELLAGILLHEGMHARLESLGLRWNSPSERLRHERICYRVMLLLASRLPNGDGVAAHAKRGLALGEADYSTETQRSRNREFALRAGVPKWIVAFIDRLATYLRST